MKHDQKFPIHEKAHPLAGRTVTIPHGDLAGMEFHVEDWWDRVSGISWKFARGNPACLQFAARTGSQKFRVTIGDEEVVYGKIGALGYLVHEMELEE